MRVLYFSRDYTNHDLRFLERLAQSPYKVYFLRLESDGIPYERRPLPPKIIPLEWNGGRNPARSPDDWFHLLPAFQEVIDRIQPDLVHAGPVQSCGFMTALLGVKPFLLMSWGSDLLVDADRDGMYRWMTCYTLERSDMLLCDSQAVRTKAQKLVQYPDARIVQFPWGIDLMTFRPGPDGQLLRRELGWEQNRVIISTRTWEELYGIRILLEAFRQAYQQDNSLRLILLGTGSEHHFVEDFISRHRLQQVVYIPGRISHDKQAGFYQAADIYLSCAHSDGTSISLLEAMAVGLVPIVTDIPSNREWITPKANGWLGIDGDPASFAKLILTAARLSPIERQLSMERNHALTRERADWTRNVELLLAAYERLFHHKLS